MRLSALVALGSLSLGSAAHAAIIYNARTSPPQGFFIIAEQDETNSGVELPGGPQEREFETRAGDAITFAGTDRFVTEFSTRLWSFLTPPTPVVTDVELTLYQNNAGLPGAAIWTGTVAGVTLNTTSAVEVIFNPNITVPNSICFGIALSNISATRDFGIVAANNTTVGTSTNGLILQDTATQVWRSEFYGIAAFNQVDARVTAVPAPAAVALLGVLGAFRRRR